MSNYHPPAMMRLIDNPLPIDSTCRQVSCHFDESLYREDTPRQLKLALPDTLERAVRKRKAEFIAGRYCARQALWHLDGTLHASIGIGADREPLWPEGWVGSITHAHGYASALVARRSNVRGVGIDSEVWVEPRIAQELGGQILTTAERYDDFRHTFESPRHYLTLVFSAKESLYKCLFPLVNKFFGFHAARILPEHSASAAGGRFRFELLEDWNAEFRAGYSGDGSYVMHEDLVHTAIVLKP
jgi:enterobactin synthetase component D